MISLCALHRPLCHIYEVPRGFAPNKRLSYTSQIDPPVDGITRNFGKNQCSCTVYSPEVACIMRLRTIMQRGMVRWWICCGCLDATTTGTSRVFRSTDPLAGPGIQMANRADWISKDHGGMSMSPGLSWFNACLVIFFIVPGYIQALVWTYQCKLRVMGREGFSEFRCLEPSLIFLWNACTLAPKVHPTQQPRARIHLIVVSFLNSKTKGKSFLATNVTTLMG